MRGDLDMPTGKLAAQAAHACAGALIAHLRDHPHHLDHFHDVGLSGSRVVLRARRLQDLLVAHYAALAAGLPCYLMRDSGHVLPPHFDGSPVITALGIGPCRREDARAITRRFPVA